MERCFRARWLQLPAWVVGSMILAACREDPSPGDSANSRVAEREQAATAEKRASDQTATEKRETSRTLPLAWVSYPVTDGGGRRRTAHALAMAVPSPKAVDGTLWVASLPGAVFPSPESGVNLYPVQGEFHALEQYRRNVYEGTMIARVGKTGLAVIFADCRVEPPPPLATGKLDDAVQAWLLDTDEKDLVEAVPNSRGGTTRRGRLVKALRSAPLGSPLQDGAAFAWPEPDGLPAVQTLAPVFTAAGECAGWLIRGENGSWTAAAVPDIAALTSESDGPFEVSARLNSRGDELEVTMEGRVSRGLRRGGFAMVLGPETDALQGFDDQGRRYLVDPKSVDRAKLKVDSLRVDPATGLHRVSIRLRVEPAKEHILAGQMLLRPSNSSLPAIPYPPFTVRVRGGAGGGLELTGNEAFRPKGSDRSGRSMVPLVADAEVIELPAAVAPNRAIFTGERLVLPTTGSPAVWTYGVEAGRLESLPSSLTGDALVVAADARRAFLLDRREGVIEAWDLERRKLISAGLVEGAGEVLAMAVLETGTGDQLVLACRERLRFLATEDFAERTPCIAPLNRNDPEFEDGYELFGNEAPLQQAVALRAPQGGLVAFHGAPHFGTAAQPVRWVVVGPHQHAGRLEARVVPGVAALGPSGITYLSDDSMRESDAIPTGRADVWSGGRSSEDGAAITGCFVGPRNLDPVFILRRVERAIPAAMPVLEARSRNRPSAAPVMLGTLAELTGCGTDLAGGGPLFSHHFFPVPGSGLLLSLDDQGKRIYRRALDTPALLDTLGGGSFTILANAPDLLRRGLPLRHQLAVSGTREPKFKIVQGPEGATISAAGVLDWPNPADHPADEVEFRVEVADGDSGRTLPWVMKARLTGVLPTRAVTHSGELLAGNLTPRIHDVPERGLIRDKLEADSGRLHVLVTETPAGTFRLEVFDAATETWMPGAELPALPAVACANPKFIHLLFPKEEALEIRKIEAPAEVRRIPLKLPVAAMGCSADSTNGVLCLAERLNPEAVKVGSFVDWDGTRVTITRSQGPKARFVFLSPTTLKPVPVTARREDLEQAVFFLGTGPAESARRIAVSPDGWQLSVPHFVLDLNGGKGPSRILGNAHHSGTAWFTDDNRTIYPGEYFRLNRIEAPGAGRASYEKVDRGNSSREIVVPVSGREMEMLVRNGNEGYEVEFHPRGKGELLFKLGPLPEVSAIGHKRPNPELGKRLVLVHADKLVSIGHRRRQIFVRDLPFDRSQGAGIRSVR